MSDKRATRREARTQRMAKRVEGNEIRRFDIHQRVQHIMMFSSFTLLAITGLPMKFSEWGISQWWIEVWGGIGGMRTVHHAAAWVMVASCAYHVVYILVAAFVLKRGFPTKMLPRVKDFKDFAMDLKYYLGLSKERPKFDRYNYREKFDYWAVFWGIFIMVGSGLILMFPVAASKVLPGWAIPFSLVAHSDEAVLAVGWILIVHMYFAHISPRVFPMNKSIFTGKVSVARYREEYPLEYAEVMAAANIDPETAEAMVISSLPAQAEPEPTLGAPKPEADSA